MVRCEKGFRKIVHNKFCTFKFADELYEEYVRQYMHDANDFLAGYLACHQTTLPSSEIDEICRKYDSVLKGNRRLVFRLECCPNATEDQLIGLLRRYNCFDSDKLKEMLAGNPNATEKVVLEMLDLAPSDAIMGRLLNSPKAGEAAFEKAFELRIGHVALEVIRQRTNNAELKAKVEAALEDEDLKSNGRIGRINSETDPAILRRLVESLCRGLRGNEFEYAKGNSISKLENPSALEMMAKMGNGKTLAAVAENPYTPEKTVLQIIRRNPNSEILRSVCGRKEKSIWMAICCLTTEPDLIRLILSKRNVKNFTSEDIMKMLKWNPSCKFDILKQAYSKLSEEQLQYLRKLKDRDVDWIVNSLLKDRKGGENEEKASRIVDRLLVAERVARGIASEFMQKAGSK